MNTARTEQPDDASRLAAALGRALGLQEEEVDVLTRYLRRLDVIEHELYNLQSSARGGRGQPVPHEGPGTWREPHPVRG